jgi:hypothetical protein
MPPTSRDTIRLGERELHLTHACSDDRPRRIACRSPWGKAEPMFTVRDVLIFAAISGLLAAAVLWLWPWARRRGRFAIAGLATFAGFAAWNLVISHANAVGLDVDAPVIALSWQDVGSGVVAFLAAALTLGLVTERDEPARLPVGAAAIAGLAAMIFDIFVL